MHSNKVIYSLYVVIYLFTYQNLALAQVLPQITNYNMGEFNAASQNWYGLQDQEGFIYVANGEESSGVLQFDGLNWRNINTDNSLMVSMDLGIKERIYTGGQNSFGYIEADSIGKFKYTALSTLLPDSLQSFGVIWQTHYLNGNVYFNNGSTHIFIWNEENQSFSIVTPEYDFHKTYEINGEVWVRDVGVAVMRIKNGKLERLPNSQMISTAAIVGVTSYSDSEAIMVINFRDTPEHTLVKYNFRTGEIEYIAQESAKIVSEGTPYCSQKISDNRLLVGTLRDGFFVLNSDGKIIEHISTKEGLEDNAVLHLFEDNQKNVWVCLNDGLSKVQISDPFRVTYEGEAFEGGVEDILRYNGRLFLSTQGGVYGHVSENKDNSVNIGNEFRQVEGIISIQCWDLLDAYGNLYVAAGERGFYKINPADFTAEQQVNFSVYQLHDFVYQDRKFIFAGGRHGLILTELKGDKIDTLWTNPATLNMIISGIEQSSIPNPDSVSFWITFESNQGIRHISTNTTAFIEGNFEVEKPYLLDSVTNGFVYSSKIQNQIYFLSRNGIFIPSISTNKTSLKKLNLFSDSFKHNEFPLRKMIKDENGSLWMVSAEDVAFSCALNANGKYECDSILFQSLDLGDFFNLYSENNKLWIAGNDGLGLLNTEIVKEIPSYKAKIRQVVTRDDSLLFAGNKTAKAIYPSPKLRYEDNALTFHFSSLFFEDPEDLEFQYRISNNDTDWSHWKKEPKAVYTNLWEGDYIFEVKAKNVYDKESEIASFNFTVTPPFYRTYFAYTTYTVLVVVMVWGVVLLNTQRLKADKIRLEKLVRKRTKEIEEQNEEIKTKNSELELQKEEISAQADNLKIANKEIINSNKALESSRKSIQEKNDKITASITYAQRIQEAMLPSNIQIQQHIPESFIFFKPRDIVSGDFYWCSQIEDDKSNICTIIAAVDCTGHGVPGAFMSMLGDAYLNQIILLQKNTDPATILYKLNNELRAALRQDFNQNRDGMDMALCTINHKENKLYFAGARNPLVYIEDKQIHKIKGNNFSVAGRDKNQDKKYTTHTIEINSPIEVYVYSDGFQDQFGGKKGRKFMTPKFRDLLFQVHHYPMSQQGELIKDTFYKWVSPSPDVHHEQVDDVLVMGFRVHPE